MPYVLSIPLQQDRKVPSAAKGVTHTHFDIGFQLTQLAGKMVMERHGEKSAKVEMFEQKVYERLLNVCCRSGVGKGFGGSIMNNHGRPRKQQAELDSVVNSCSAGTSG